MWVLCISSTKCVQTSHWNTSEIVSSLCIGPHGDGLLVAGLFFTDYPPSWEKIPPVEDPGLCDPLGEPGWLSW